MHRRDLKSLIASGESADVMRLGNGKVLKLFHAGVEDGVMRRELDVATRASEEGLLVPRALGWQNIEGRRGIVFEELDGAPLLDPKSRWRSLRARAALRKLAECHARIHQCSAEGLIHHQHDILWVRILSAEIDETLRREALDRILVTPRGHILCHGDFHPGNAVETPRGVAAVDWSSGCAGDPAADVARTEMLLRYGQMRGPSRIALWFRQFAAELYLRHYQRITGMSDAALDYWRLPVAVSGLSKGSKMHRPALIKAVERYRNNAK
ncbi:phosphotransferase family protein [Sphingomonas sp. SRS2]|uniref:phosphotransferase family protein n=1 Tax=Sphingomonas sp. SRS2 TaxID=133190 RepID=UPI0006184046|nr:aminoglycoside phosphotransferase family protein [Sphingomonas sp. SRS2]KKC24535.1 hypothetical protein WP12_18755 [Sphingomonas sp. SRS2]